MIESSGIRPATGDSLRRVFDQTSHLIWLLSPDGTITDVNRTALTRMGAGADEVAGSALWELPWWNEESAALLRTAFAEPITVARELPVRALDAQSEPISLEFVVKPVSNFIGAVELLLAEGKDVTARQATLARLARSIERLSSLTTLSQSLTDRWRRHGLYDEVVEIVASLTGAESVILMMKEDGRCVVRGVHGGARDTLLGSIFTDEAGIACGSFRQDDAIVVRGEECASRLHQTLLEHLMFHPQSVVAVPMIWEGQRVGAIEIVHSDPGAFPEEDISLLQMVGAWVTVVLINAQLWDEQQEARQLAESRRERVRMLARRIVSTQETERQRIARELHDETGQVLTALKMKLSMMKQRFKSSEHEEEFTEALAMISDMMKNVRHIAHDLRPPALDTFGLEAALEGMCGEFSRHSGIRILYEGEKAPSTSDDAKIVLYRFVQEALTNIGKHSGATEATVSVLSDDSAVIVRVTDNGRGFDPDATPHGIGLVGMSERLDWLEGTLDIQANANEGTTLTARVPL